MVSSNNRPCGNADFISTALCFRHAFISLAFCWSPQSFRTAVTCLVTATSSTTTTSWEEKQLPVKVLYEYNYNFYLSAVKMRSALEVPPPWRVFTATAIFSLKTKQKQVTSQCHFRGVHRFRDFTIPLLEYGATKDFLSATNLI